ncbi:MAG: hypothetical protein MI974_09660 [Chitinophagales bacterium]|nr:hypothetical protein [Chitinophagales bacterium]
MTNRRFKRAAQLNRTKAVFFTVAFHVMLLGGIAYSTDADYESYMPDVVKEWLNIDIEENEVAQKDEAIRP